MHPIAQALKTTFRYLPTARLREIVHDRRQFRFGHRKTVENPVFAFEGVKESDDEFYTKDKNLFIATLARELPNLIEESRENIFQLMQEMVYLENGSEMRPDGFDPFHLVKVFGQMCLRHSHPDPQVQYPRLLGWRDVTRMLGEDLFSCAFLACEDAKRNSDRAYFAWPPTLATDNIRLQRMLGQGIAENHYHLKGSAPHFFLSWLNLMNFPTGRWKAFAEAGLTGQRLSIDQVYDPNYRPEHLYQLIKLAALIRARLFLLLREESPCMSSAPRQAPSTDRLIEMIENSDNIDLFYHDEARIIPALRMEYGYRIAGKEVIDYAIPQQFDEVNRNPNLPFIGERALIYRFLERLYRKDKVAVDHQAMFHLYLLIKSRFRSEMVQANGMSGFKNFLHYQDRKKAFLKNRPFWQDLFHYLCLQINLQYPNLLSLEARLVPGKTADEAADEIAMLDDLVGHFPLHPNDPVRRWLETLSLRTGKPEPEHPRHFYVYHFIKKAEKPKGRMRNEESRWAVKAQAQAIFDLRKKAAREAGRIYGLMLREQKWTGGRRSLLRLSAT